MNLSYSSYVSDAFLPFRAIPPQQQDGNTIGCKDSNLLFISMLSIEWIRQSHCKVRPFCYTAVNLVPSGAHSLVQGRCKHQHNQGIHSQPYIGRNYNPPCTLSNKGHHVTKWNVGLAVGECPSSCPPTRRRQHCSPALVPHSSFGTFHVQVYVQISCRVLLIKKEFSGLKGYFPGLGCLLVALPVPVGAGLGRPPTVRISGHAWATSWCVTQTFCFTRLPTTPSHACEQQ